MNIDNLQPGNHMNIDNQVWNYHMNIDNLQPGTKLSYEYR